MKISVVIAAKNEESMLRGCIKSIKFAEEIILVDDNSSDQTANMARALGAKVYKRKLDGFATQKNYGIDKANNDWVLILDADERVSQELAKEIMTLKAQKDVVAYDMPFRNFVGNYWLKYGGMYPDRHTRLFNKKHARYGEREIHEVLEFKGGLKHLKNDIIHYTYKDYAEYLTKVKKYAALEAKLDSERPSSLDPARTFYGKYVKEMGYRDGLHGLKSAVLLSYYPHLKRRLMK